MKNNDRKTPSGRNEIKYPKSRVNEPTTYAELKVQRDSARASLDMVKKERDEFKNQAEEETKNYESTLTLYQTVEDKYNSTHTLYIEEQRKGQVAIEELQKSKTQAQSYLTMYDLEKAKRNELTIQLNTVKTQYKSTLTLYAEEQRRARKGESAIEELEAAKTQAQSYFRLHQDSQAQAQSYLTMYDSEKVRGDELVIQLNEVQGHRDRYLTLYNETQSELKTERRSKAGVKGWETRRKKENEKLKQEISEMASVLRDSIERKDEAIDSLYSVAERMDRIQRMVDSVDDDTATNPIGMVQKLQRMWQAVKEILAE